MSQALAHMDAGKVYPARCSTCEALQQVPLACVDCHELLAHVMGADYFELFGLHRSYDLDEPALSAKYMAVSRNIHPDRFGTAGPDMQNFALRASAQINKAYAVLKDPFHRAEYLLESAGGKSAGQDRRVPGPLLAEVMMLREQLEESRESGDTAALSRIQAEVQSREAAARETIGRLCRTLVENATDAVRDELRLELNAMKYLNNLLADVSTERLPRA